MSTTTLSFALPLALHASNGGLFISRGVGRHPRRVINSFELIYVTRGKLEIEEEGRRFSVGAEQTLLLWPGREHGGTEPYPPDLQFFWAHFSLPETASPCGAMVGVPQHAATGRPEHMSSLFRRLLNEQELLGERQVAMSLMLTLILWEVTNSPASGGAQDGSAAVLAARAEAIICTAFHKPIGTSTIAAELGCNADYLGRVFRSIYRCTVTEAIHARRMREAMALLTSQSTSIDLVASQCGFEETGYFRRLFKRATGMTPQDYRKLHTRIHVNTA